MHECVERGGKVLIPVFALGRAQELCILLESYWERTNLKVPVYFSLGLTEKVGGDAASRGGSTARGGGGGLHETLVKLYQLFAHPSECCAV